MRYIVLRTVTDGSQVTLEALISLTHKASGIEANWIKFEKASTNCLEPEKCSLLSFGEDERDDLEENLELWGFDNTVAIIGVEPLEDVKNVSVNNEP